MIYIKEEKTKQVPGLTSLFVSFDYNKDAVEVVKSCDGSKYNKKNKIWEVPILNLSYLLDMLVLIDDVTLQLVKDKNPKIYKYEPKDDLLFPHQVEGVQFGLNHDKWLLLDAPGLGKTLQIIRLAEQLKERENIQHCLIICGLNSLKQNWRKEIQKFSNLSCRIIGKRINSRGREVDISVADCVEQLKQPIDEFFLIINVEKLRDDKLISTLIKNKPNKIDLIVVDELHVAKSSTSQQGQNLLKTKSKYQVGATGTLLLNDPIDAYVPLKWIGAERSTVSDFKKYYYRYEGFGGQVTGYKNLAQLKDQIEKVSLRRKKDLLDLPPKNVIDEFVEMDEKQSKFYNNVKAGIKDEVDKVVLRTSNLLAMIARLRQATECPQVLTTEDIPSAKIDRCVDLAEQILSDPQEKLVVFSMFKEPLNPLMDRLKKYNPFLCTGDVDDSVIANNITTFQEDDEHRVMLCTVSKMGTGVTLNRAGYSIFLSTPWTDGVQTQAEDRIHRIGTKKPVFVFRLWTKDTIDERVLELINTKKALSDYVVDDDMSEQTLDVLRKYIQEMF